MSRFTRSALSLGTIVCLVGVLAACAPNGSSGDTKDSVTIGMNSNVSTLDPAQTQSVGTDLSVIGSIYSSLVRRAPDLSLAPDLATSWTQDGTTWTFKLDPKAKFENGNPLDSSVVKWNMDRVMDEDKAYRAASALRSVESVEAPSPQKLVIHTKQPDFKLPAELTYLFFLDPEWASTHNPSVEAMGSGPYSLVDFGGGQTVKLAKSESYWGAQTPSIANVTFQASPNAASRVSSIIAQNLDVATTFSPADAERLKASDNVTVTSQESVNTSYFLLNTLEPPMDNVLLRQAANYAVNKQDIADSVFGGLTSPNNGQVFADTQDGYNAEMEGYPYDPDKAKALLKKAGYDGTPIELDVPTGTYINAEQVAQAVADQLKAVGFNIDLQTMPFTVYLTKYVSERNMAPISYIRTLVPSQTALGTYTFLFVSESVYSYFHNDEFDRMVDQALDADNEADRNAVLADAAELLRDEAAVIFLFQEPTITAQAKDLKWKARQDSWVLPAEMSWN